MYYTKGSLIVHECPALFHWMVKRVASGAADRRTSLDEMKCSPLGGSQYFCHETGGWWGSSVGIGIVTGGLALYASEPGEASEAGIHDSAVGFVPLKVAKYGIATAPVKATDQSLKELDIVEASTILD